jgi:AraC family transcriptional regulator
VPNVRSVQDLIAGLDANEKSRLNPVEHTCLDPGHFFGVNRLERRVAGFLLSETHYRGGLLVPPHVHELPYYAFLLAGGYQEHLGRQTVTCAPQSFVFHPSHEVRHGRLCDAGARLFHVEIAPRCLAVLRDEGCVPSDSTVLTAGPLVTLSLSLYREFRQTDTASALAIEGLSLEILGALLRSRLRADARHPRWLERAREHVHDDVARTLSVESVAADVGVSAVRLSRAFRRAFGESLGSYQRRLRVRLACERLRDSSLSLAEIALDAGFTDQSHFTRVFKRLIGATPAVFRREHCQQ